MSQILEVRNLHVRYGKVEALFGVDLDIEPGRIVTVIGPNGAGKSTMLNAIVGAMPSNGSATGVVRLAGSDIARYDIEQRVARGLCLVPEKRELFGSMSVEDNLLLGAYARMKAGDRNYLDQLDTVYELFPRLNERRTQAAGTMSGGERQMLALGRALMARPRLLMLDEPSLGLAPLIVREIFRIISELRKRGVSILLVEQNARAALQVADYAYVLENGAVKLHGEAASLSRDPRVFESYLGVTSKHQEMLSTLEA